LSLPGLCHQQRIRGNREKTGCNVIAIFRDTKLLINPNPDERFTAGDEILLIGTVAAKKAFTLKHP
jgi:K+/H+ antiporter YhaU regulatory subunit KhtT